MIRPQNKLSKVLSCAEKTFLKKIWGLVEISEALEVSEPEGQNSNFSNLEVSRCKVQMGSRSNMSLENASLTVVGRRDFSNHFSFGQPESENFRPRSWKNIKICHFWVGRSQPENLVWKMWVGSEVENFCFPAVQMKNDLRNPYGQNRSKKRFPGSF